LKALTSALQEASKITVFYPDLLNDHSLNIILNKIINGGLLEMKSLENMFESIRNILLQTKAPIKLLIATSILKITELPKNNWKEKEEGSIITILKILHFNIMSIED
jgi:hypothetical protein